MTPEEIKIAKSIVEAAVVAAGFKVGSSVHWPKNGRTQAFSFKMTQRSPQGHPVVIAEIDKAGAFTVHVDRDFR